MTPTWMLCWPRTPWMPLSILYLYQRLQQTDWKFISTVSKDRTTKSLVFDQQVGRRSWLYNPSRSHYSHSTDTAHQQGRTKCHLSHQLFLDHLRKNLLAQIFSHPASRQAQYSFILFHIQNIHLSTSWHVLLCRLIGLKWLRRSMWAVKPVEEKCLTGYLDGKQRERSVEKTL